MNRLEAIRAIRKKGQRVTRGGASKVVPELLALCQEFVKAEADEARAEKRGRNRMETGGVDRGEA